MERRKFITNISLGIAGVFAGKQILETDKNNLINSTMDTAQQAVNKFMMLSLNVKDMPKAKSFYVDKLGLKIVTEYRVDDNNWWVSLNFPGGGAVLTLARAGAYPDNIKPGTLALYFSTSDIAAANKELIGKGVRVNPVQDDLFGPGSGVKFFRLEDPEGNLVHIVEEHPARAPF